jgi:hypothetical protein
VKPAESSKHGMYDEPRNDPYSYQSERHTTQDLRIDDETGKPCMV